jgi:hypothetical protein
MKPQSAKAKGRNLQKWTRDLILETFGLSAPDVRSTSMGASGVDILLSTHAATKCPLSIECKNLAKIAVYQHYEQASTNAESTPGLEPVVIMKQNHSKPLVVVDAEYFFRLLAERK